MAIPKKVVLLGKYLTSCTIAYGNVVNGSLAFSTPIDISENGTRTFVSLTYTPRPQNVETTNATALVVQRQNQRVDFSMRVVEQSLANVTGVLATANNNGTHARIIATYRMPGESVDKAIAGIGILDGGPRSIQDGANTAELTINADDYAPHDGLASAIPSYFTA